MRSLVPPMVGLGLVLALAPLAPSMAADEKPCQAARGPDAVAGCRAAVANGTATPRELATTLWERGRNAARAGDSSAALADLDAAIATDPTLAGGLQQPRLRASRSAAI